MGIFYAFELRYAYERFTVLYTVYIRFTVLYIYIVHKDVFSPENVRNSNISCICGKFS